MQMIDLDSITSQKAFADTHVVCCTKSQVCRQPFAANGVLPHSVLLVASDEEALKGDLPISWVQRLRPRRFGKVFCDDVSACRQVLGYFHHLRQLRAFLSSMLFYAAVYADSHMALCAAIHTCS